MPGKICFFMNVLKMKFIYFFENIKKNLPQNCPVDLSDQEIHHQMINDELYDRFDDFYFSNLEYREPVDHLEKIYTIILKKKIRFFDLPIFMVFPGAI